MSKDFNNRGGYIADNQVILIRGGLSYFNKLINLIDNARESVHFQVYIYEDDETGTLVADALCAAAQRGVQVFMLVDGYASRPLSSSFIDRLRVAGVHFRWFEPLLKGSGFFIGRRMHHKVVVADAEKSLVGGMNISDRYNDMPGQPAWLDWAVLVTGPVSTALYNRCLQMWYKKAPAFRHLPQVNPATINQQLVRVRVNDAFRKRNQISRSYLEMLRHAQTEITFMSSYFMPGRAFRKHLRLASRRGVKIRIILTKVSDVPIAKQAERFFYPWLLRRNVEIYEYRQKVLHGKMAVCDNLWVTVGSYNLNDLSAYASIELNLDIHQDEFSEDVSRRLNEIITQDCDRITQAYLEKNTHWWNKVAYRVAYGIGRLFLLIFTYPFTGERSAHK